VNGFTTGLIVEGVAVGLTIAGFGPTGFVAVVGFV
jgi:hypothetical protein